MSREKQPDLFEQEDVPVPSSTAAAKSGSNGAKVAKESGWKADG